MVSLFGLWIETRARLAGRGPALPQKGGALQATHRRSGKASNASPGCRKDAPEVHDFCTRARNGLTANGIAQRRPQIRMAFWTLCSWMRAGENAGPLLEEFDIIGKGGLLRG